MKLSKWQSKNKYEPINDFCPEKAIYNKHSSGIKPDVGRDQQMSQQLTSRVTAFPCVVPKTVISRPATDELFLKMYIFILSSPLCTFLFCCIMHLWESDWNLLRCWDCDHWWRRAKERTVTHTHRLSDLSDFSGLTVLSHSRRAENLTEAVVGECPRYINPADPTPPDQFRPMWEPLCCYGTT